MAESHRNNVEQEKPEKMPKTCMESNLAVLYLPKSFSNIAGGMKNGEKIFMGREGICKIASTQMIKTTHTLL